MSHFTVSGDGHLTCTNAGSFTARESSGTSNANTDGPGDSEVVVLSGLSEVFSFFFTQSNSGGWMAFYITGGQSWDNNDNIDHLKGGGTITVQFRNANDDVISDIGQITFINQAQLTESGSPQQIEQRLRNIFPLATNFMIKIPYPSATNYIPDWNPNYDDDAQLFEAMSDTSNTIEIIRH